MFSQALQTKIDVRSISRFAIDGNCKCGVQCGRSVRLARLSCMLRIVANLLLVCTLSGCSLFRHNDCAAGCSEDKAFAVALLLVPFLRCSHPQMYRVQDSTGSYCLIPASTLYIYNQSTTSFATTSVTGVVTLECRPGLVRVWGKIANSNPAPGSSIVSVSNALTLSSYSVGDTLFCINGNDSTYHKVVVL